MQSEQDMILSGVQDWAERDDSAAERYQYFTRPEPKEDLGPIYEVDDPYLGPNTQVREMTIGMVRNAKAENKKTVLAYLKPFPHMRVDDAKPLQGWYQDKFNIDKDGDAHRPRPCFTEAILTSPFSGYCAVGCPFSLPAGELVDTPLGPKAIEKFQEGDWVWGRDLETRQIVPAKVLGTSKHYKPEGYIVLGWSNSTVLRLTADHPVWSPGEGKYLPASEVQRGLTISGEEVEVAGQQVVQTGLDVYDIQTATGNFYHQGVLVSNCYINSGMRGYRGSGLIVVPLNYGAQIRRQLTGVRRAAAGYFSSFTDPFTPLEAYYHNTQEAAEEFVKIGLPIFFLSRLPYPEWAIDLLTLNPHSYAQKSINTSDPVDWRHLSPGAMGLEDHLKEITKLKKRGIYISIQVNPILPGVTSKEQILKLFSMLKAAGADHVIVKFVEAAYSWAPAMVQRIKKVFGKERGEEFERLFNCNIGGERTIDEEYRLRAHRLFSAHARRIGLSYATCYEYAYERDDNGKILSKTGVSIGRQFTTSAQCHGHQVPVYVRNSAEEQFRPLEECPPSGCLYCADENEGKPRCGDELAGEANAVRMSDLKTPIGTGKARSTGVQHFDLLQLGVLRRNLSKTPSLFD